MTIRVILVPLAGEARDKAQLSAAFALADRLNAHVDGVFVEPDPYDAISSLGLFAGADAIDRISREAAKHAKQRRQLAESEFRTACTNANAHITEAALGTDRLSARWRTLSGLHDDLVGREGRYADLVVFSRGEVGSDRHIRRAFEQALLNTGRPLLLVPTSPRPSVQTVGVAWDGSVAAARAVANALPLLRMAATVKVLTVQSAPTQPDDLDRLSEYLVWHGIACEGEHIESKDASIGTLVLETAKEEELDLLVMGGYGHSPRRDLTLGSVTYHVLSSPDANFSVFMAH